MFEELKGILGEPFEVTNRIHRWKIGDENFSVFDHWRPETFGYIVKDDKGLAVSGGEGLDHEGIIETARWAIRRTNRD